MQYRKDLTPPTYESILKETDSCFPLDIKNSLLLRMLYDVLKEVSDSEAINELKSIKEGIELI